MKEQINHWERRLSGEPPVKNGFTSKLERKVRERIHMQTKRKRLPIKAIAATLGAVAVIGCGWLFRDDLQGLLQKNQPSDALASIMEDPLAESGGTLKAAIFPYGDFDEIRKPFIIRHPSVQIELATAPFNLEREAAKYVEWLEKEQPDLVMVPLNLFGQLAQEGKLKAIDALIKKDEFDLDQLHQPLVELLRTAGGGELYGLPMEFASRALFINKTLFAEKGITLPDPEGTMTLDDVLALASRFTGSGVQGLTTDIRNAPYELVRLIGQTQGLQTVALEQGKYVPMVQSDSWKQIWEKVANGLAEGWIKLPGKMDFSKQVSMNEIMKNDLFAQGKAAMSLADNTFYANLVSQEQRAKEGGKLDWMTVSYQIDPAATNQIEYLSTPYVYAVTADSPNEKAAWELLKFIAGSANAKRMDQSDRRNGRLLNRTSEMKSAAEDKWSGFYGMKVDPAKVVAEWTLRGDSRYLAAERIIQSEGDQQFRAVLEQQKSIDQALADLQTSLQASFAKLGKPGEGA